MPISQPPDDAAPYTWTQPIRDAIAVANSVETAPARITALENSGGSGSVQLTPHPSDGTLFSFNSIASATAPGAPTIGTATAGSGSATVSFTPPSNTGGAAITGYTVTSTPGGVTATGTASPITIGGLTNGTAYTFKVKATNSAGTGPESAASNSVTPQASTGAENPPAGTSAGATWWIPFGSAPINRVTYETGVTTGGQARVVWVPSMPDVRARTTPRETGVAAQAQSAYQAYIEDLTNNTIVADSGVVLGAATSWVASGFTPVAGRRYKGYARCRAADGQWSPYHSTRFVAPTGVVRHFETYGMVGDGTTQSGTDYGSAVYTGPIRTAISACNPGDVLRPQNPGVILSGLTVSGTTVTGTASAFTGRTGQRIFIYAAGVSTTAGDSYGHRTTISSVNGDGSQATLAAAAPTAIAASAGRAMVNYPIYRVGHVDLDAGANSPGGVTIEGPAMFTSSDVNYSGFRVALPDFTFNNCHWWTGNVTTRGNGKNNESGHWFIDGSQAVGTRIINCYAEKCRDAGFLFFGGCSDAHVVDCTVDHSMADPFHVTGFAFDIQFIRTLAVQVGDDAVANIGYRSDGDSNRPYNIIWENPRMIGQNWGRGLSFGGSRNCLATDVDFNGGAMASFLIGSDGDQASTDRVQVRRFTVKNAHLNIGTKPTYSQGGATGSTVSDDPWLKLINNGNPVRQSNILMEDGSVADGRWVQVVCYSGGEFQDGTVILRGITMTGQTNSGGGWLDQNTYSGHIDFRGITVPAGSTGAAAPANPNS